MKIGSSKTGVVLLAAALLIVIVIAACGGSDPEELEIPVSIVDGQMSPDTIEVKQGDTVTLKVESEEYGDFHLHTYDIEKEVGGAEPVDLIFVADATGRFRITFHATGEEHEEDNGEGHKEEEVDLGFLEVRPR
jgi:hypothetical protein